MAHLLSVLPYEQPVHVDVVLPPLQERSYVRPPKKNQHFVPVRYAVRPVRDR